MSAAPDSSGRLSIAISGCHEAERQVTTSASSALLVIILACSASGAPLWAHCPSFGDVPPNHWACDAINKWVDAGLLVGEQGFRGDDPVTRYKAAVFAASMLDAGNGPVVAPVSAQDIARASGRSLDFRLQLINTATRLHKLEAAVREMRDEVELLRSHRGRIRRNLLDHAITAGSPHGP